MTTPQNVLYDIQYKLKQLIEMLQGSHEENEDDQDIYERCKAIAIETFEFNERLEILEDKINIVIKLLGKND